MHRRVRINAEISTTETPDDIEEIVREALKKQGYDVQLVAFFSNG